MTNEQHEKYGHLSDDAMQAEIDRLRREGDAHMQHADELERLDARIKQGGFTTLGELIEAEKEK